MKKLFTIVFLFSIAAWSQGSRQAPKHSTPPPQESSETDSQSGPVKTTQTLTPNAGESELTLIGNYIFGTLETDSPSISVDVNGPLVGVSYFYGLDQNNSVGLSFGYSSIKTSASILGTSFESKTKGFDNILLGYKGNFSLGLPTLFISGMIGIPPEKEKSDSDKGESTTSNGQITVPLTVGLVAPFSQLKLGGLITYQFAAKGNGEVIESGTTYTGDVTGGNSVQFRIFGELENDAHPNFEIMYLRSYTTYFKSAGLNTDSPGSKEIVGTLSLRLALSPTFDLIPSFAYATFLNKSDLGYSKADIYKIGVNGRILF